MALIDDIRMLRAVAFFEPLDDDALRLLAFSSQGETAPPGAVVAATGQPADGAIALLSGRIAAEGGATFEAPDLILPRALIVPVTAAQTITVETDSRLLRIRRDMFRRLLEEYPSVAEALRQRFAATLLATTSAFEAALARTAQRLR